MRGVFLKNINLTGISVSEQWEKVLEEQSELVQALDTESDENVISEFFDLMQTWLGYIYKKRNITAEEVQEYYHIWIKKLKNRPRDKKCSKCINCELIEYTNIDDVLFCNQGQFATQEYIAKNCRCYEEK